MATLADKHYIRKLRKGNKEILISVSTKFLRENNLEIGDYIDLRTLKKAKKSSQEKS